MSGWLSVVITILIIVLILFAILLFVGNKLQKKANSQQEAMAAAAQTVSMLIIDKKKLKISEANLPKMVTEQMPKYARRAKFPIVKARVTGAGSKPMNLIADSKVFDILPVGKECKVVISGIYITDIKSVRGGTIPTPPKKKSLMAKLKAKAENATNSTKTDSKDTSKKKK